LHFSYAWQNFSCTRSAYESTTACQTMFSDGLRAIALLTCVQVRSSPCAIIAPPFWRVIAEMRHSSLCACVLRKRMRCAGKMLSSLVLENWAAASRSEAGHSVVHNGVPELWSPSGQPCSSGRPASKYGFSIHPYTLETSAHSVSIRVVGYCTAYRSSDPGILQVAASKAFAWC